MGPIPTAVAELRRQGREALAQAADETEREAVRLDLLASSLGLLAAVLAAEPRQLELVDGLLRDWTDALQPVEPTRACLVLALVLARGRVAPSAEAQQVVARLFREADAASARALPGDRPAILLAGAARLLAAAAAGADREGCAAALVARAELTLAQHETPDLAAAATAVAAGLAALGAGLGGPEPPVAGDVAPLAVAAEAALALATWAATGRGGALVC